jgi:hypothetical protein
MAERTIRLSDQKVTLAVERLGADPREWLVIEVGESHVHAIIIEPALDLEGSLRTDCNGYFGMPVEERRGEERDTG